MRHGELPAAQVAHAAATQCRPTSQLSQSPERAILGDQLTSLDGPRDPLLASRAKVGHLVPGLPGRRDDLRAEPVGLPTRRREQRAHSFAAEASKPGAARHPFGRLPRVPKLHRQVSAAQLES